MNDMKKSLITGTLVLVAVATIVTGCSRDEFDGDLYEAKKQAFEQVFKSEFGDINPNQTWGFGDGSITRGITRANTGETYPATHEYTDANGNVIAGANMNHNQWADPNEYYGGWVVPDALTEGQKERVRLYFQANPNLSYQDPQYRHFFVQQVYQGGTSAPSTGNHEATAGANGQTHAGMTLNQLTVGQTGSHINDFNAGTCSPSDVLDNGQTVNGGTTHSDQITLMVNVYDTSCFGYHETNGSDVQTSTNHNDKMALVSAETIDAWAAQNGNPGEAVTDKWNRSFMGFDYELLPECDIVQDSYALLSQVPNINNIQYAWDGTKVMTIGPVPEGTGTTKNDDFDLFPYFAMHASGSNNATCTTVDGKISCYFPQYSSITFGQGNQDWSPYSKLVIEFEASPINGTVMGTAFKKGDTKVEVTLDNVRWYGDNQGPDISTYDGSTGTLNITSVMLIGKTIEGTTVDPSMYYNPTYLLGDADTDKISFYSENTNMYGGIVRTLSEDEMKITKDGKTCLDLTLFQTLKTQGYHPTSSDLKTWVKWQAACDGYYSDWIVTLTEAQRIGDDPVIPPTTDEYTEEFTYNVVKESGRVFCEDLGQVSNRDLDYNDVVFDAWIYVNRVYRHTVTKTTIGGATTYTYKDTVFVRETPSKTVIRLLAAGGTIPIQVAGVDVHQMMGYIPSTTMINTMTEASVTYGGLSWDANYINNVEPVVFTPSNVYSRIIDIPIVVRSSTSVYELTAYQGQAPQKFLAPIGTPWPAERCELKLAFPYFENWVQYGILPWDNKNATYLYDTGEIKNNLTFKTEAYCAAQWDPSTSTFTWGQGGWDTAWTFMAAEGVSGNLSDWDRLHLKVSDFTNASDQLLKVVFKKNDGSNPPSGPTKEFFASPNASGDIDILLSGVDWGNCDIYNIQDLTIYGCMRDDNSRPASVKVTEAYYVKK